MLQPVDMGGGYERCVICGALAVGPCARCRSPVCGDCCVLTSGGARQYAICLRCEKKGSSLSPAWMTVLWWFVAPVLLVAALLFLLGVVFGID